MSELENILNTFEERKRNIERKVNYFTENKTKKNKKLKDKLSELDFLRVFSTDPDYALACQIEKIDEIKRNIEKNKRETEENYSFKSKHAEIDEFEDSYFQGEKIRINSEADQKIKDLKLEIEVKKERNKNIISNLKSEIERLRNESLKIKRIYNEFKLKQESLEKQ